MESPNISVLANLIRYSLAKLLSDSPLATWRAVSAIPAYTIDHIAPRQFMVIHTNIVLISEISVGPVDFTDVQPRTTALQQSNSST